MTSLLTLRAGRLELTLMERGATWLSCRVPLPDGSSRETILGCPTPEAYSTQDAYLGATIGRYANRICEGRIEFGGRRSTLAIAPGMRHHLHGGPDGFDRRRWHVDAFDGREVRFALDSPDGDQGYPGALRVQVVYRLLDEFTIDMATEAQVSAPSPVCITNHAYFNLDAHHDDVRGHGLSLSAQHYLPVDAELIPRDGLAEVASTGFDFRTRRPLARTAGRIDERSDGSASGAYDHAFLLDADCAGLARPAATLWGADASLGMRLYTTLPALQLYTGQYLAGINGRDGKAYPAYAGIALEPQFLPDSPNHPEWPQASCWLQPNQVYRQRIRYRFFWPGALGQQEAHAVAGAASAREAESAAR